MEYEGNRYNGGFEYGMQHGKGHLIYEKPLDGVAEVKGEWKYGKLIKSDNTLVEHNDKVIAEYVLYRQKERVADALSSIEENNPDVIEMYFVGIAGDGGEGVFRREVNFIRQVFDRDYATENKSTLLVNGNVSYRQIPLATVTSIEQTLQGVADNMDLDNDILFIHLTSHGSSDFIFQLDQQGVDLMSLTAERMGQIVKALPVRHKVVEVSACYAGGYIQPLKDDNTMVIVASSADKTSFGCSDTAEMTYFGEAFFKDALPQSISFGEAFDRSKDII